MVVLEVLSFARGGPLGSDSLFLGSLVKRPRNFDFHTGCGPASADATWTTQQAELPSHDWVVLDHAPGTSFGLGVTATATHVFTARGSVFPDGRRGETRLGLISSTVGRRGETASRERPSSTGVEERLI